MTETTQTEAQRVKAILERDRAEADREQRRREAELQVRSGNFANIADTVMEPTPEWVGKGDVMPFTPKQHNGTTRVFRTVRRVSNPLIVRMRNAGKISDDHFDACRWYRAQFDQAGLEGRYKSSHISLTGNTGGGGGLGQSPMALHESEAQARINFRAARDAMQAFYLRFFDAVVLDDVPLKRAARFAKCRTEAAPRRFRDCCNQLLDFLARNHFEVAPEEDAD